MKKNTSLNKKNNITIRFSILFITLIVSHLSYSCFKEKDVPPTVSNSLKKFNAPPIYAEIPDANFKAYLKTIVPLAFTTDNKFISNHPSVVSYNKSISIRSKKFTSLSGIEYFISLTRLDCMGNQLTTLDVSKNIALTELFCGDNHLTSLDVSRNPNLKILECSYNKLTSLDVSKNTNLKWLNCERNQLITLNLGKNNVLKSIICSFNQLTTIDVSKNTNLTKFECYNNQLTTVDVSQNKSLTSLYCYYNQLTCLDVSNNTILIFLCIDDSLKCCHPSIKAFRDRGGDLLDSHYHTILPFTCL